MSKLDYPRRSSGLFRKAESPNPPAGHQTPAGALATVEDLKRVIGAVYKTAKRPTVAVKGSRPFGPLVAPLAKPSTPKPGRPITPTGDPKKDARNKRQRELMQKRRKEAK